MNGKRKNDFIYGPNKRKNDSLRPGYLLRMALLVAFVVFAVAGILSMVGGSVVVLSMMFTANMLAGAIGLLVIVFTMGNVVSVAFAAGIGTGTDDDEGGW